MFHPSQPRAISRADRAARIRPVQAAAAFGALVGLGIGCAYLGGTVAKTTTVRAQAERIQGATAAGFTEEALAAAAGGLDSSALSIARRHDPYTVAGAAQRDRQAELLTARLEQLRPDRSDLRRASLTEMTAAARPFRMENALDASRDLECLTQAAYYEARGEGTDGMRAVAQVVLNRARHASFPSTVCSVVFQGSGRRVGCQFSFTCDGSMRAPVNRAAWNRARNVASAALSGAVFPGVGNATFFHTTGVSPSWRNSFTRVAQVGSHVFYRYGGRAGSSNAFSYDAVPASRSADVQRTVYAGIDPAETVRQAGQAIAYTAVLAQEAAQGAPAQPAAETARPAPAPAAAPAAPAPKPADTESAGTSLPQV